MPSWRISTLTGLSETTFTPPVDISSLAPPAPTFALYADDASSITSSGGVVSAWGGLTQATGGNRPLLITDSVTGIAAVRFDTGKTLSTSDPTVAVLSQSATTLILVARQRIIYAGATQTLLDNSSNGSTAGFQILAQDSNGPGQYRILRPRVSSGSSWVIDHASNGPANTYEALKTFVAAVQTSGTHSRVTVDHALSYDDPYSISMPAGTPGALVLGNCQWDVFAIEIWSPALSETAAQARVDALATRFGINPVVYVASDNFVNWYGFPSMATLANGNLFTTYRSGIEHSNHDSSGRAIFSTSGGTSWTGDYQLWASGGNGDDFRDPNVTTLANNDVLLSFFVNPAVGVGRLYWIKNSSNGAQGSWTSPVQVTKGHDGGEGSSVPILEGSGGRWIWFTYTKNVADAHYCSRIWYSDNHSTWTEVTLADGNADSRDYTECGGVIIHTAIAGYSVGDILALVRDETTGTMREVKVTSNGTVAGSLIATGTAANSAPRGIQLADGTILFLLRPNAQLVATLYMRNAAGDWTDVPTAPALDAYPGSMVYGTILEPTPGGDLAIISSVQQGNNPNDRAIVTFRKWPSWQPKGRMPIIIAPSNPTLTVSTTQQFTARGAGNFTWTATGGSIDASTGLLTVGPSNGTFSVTATDLNGYAQSSPYTATGAAAIENPDVTYGAALKQWLRGDLGSVSSWTDKSGNGKHATQATGGFQPSILTANLNGQNVYRFAAGAYMAHALNLTAPSMVFIVMAARDALSLGEAYTAGPGVGAIEASVNGSRHWGIYASGASSSGVSILNTFKICCMVYRSDTDCDLITDGSTVNVNPGSPFFGIKNNVGVDNGGLADPIASDIAEIIAVQGSVTPTQLGKTLAYLQNRYGAI